MVEAYSGGYGDRPPGERIALETRKKVHVQVGNRVPVDLVVHLLRSKLRAKGACNQHALGPPGASIVERIGLLDVAARHDADVPGQGPSQITQPNGPRL
jgi:hypothetical protein